MHIFHFISYHNTICLVYKAKASIAPPSTANPPRATFFGTAALDAEIVAGAVPVALPEALVLVVGFTLPEVESVVLPVDTDGAAETVAVVPLTTTTALELLDFAAEDVVSETEVEVGVYEALEEICMVLVDAALSDVVEEDEPAAVTEEEEAPLAVMWNGNDHWKIVGSWSQEIWIP